VPPGLAPVLELAPVLALELALVRALEPVQVRHSQRPPDHSSMPVP